jgi:hypothetical protein
MIVNIWSTPRTGSNWYSAYVLNEQKKTYPTTAKISQYLNYYHLINYYGDTDWVYEYTSGGAYLHYFYDELKQSIDTKAVFQKRQRDSKDEENYRIQLLEKHNKAKFPLVFHSHVAPMTEHGYKYLFDLADKNIFLYREDIVKQMSSYALAYATKQWKPTHIVTTYEDIEVSFDVLENLFQRILLWHKLDKTGCEVVKYEDLDFRTMTSHMPKKQNTISAFDQLSGKTQKFIIDCQSRLKELL